MINLHQFTTIGLRYAAFAGMRPVLWIVIFNGILVLRVVQGVNNGEFGTGNLKYAVFSLESGDDYFCDNPPFHIYM